ncbi:MAG: class I SAM-dependent rRNA methyltransferase [Verrucomicrobia bacterium]|nr:class I SAM-dependent rRNA methyltransferase [Verrucomicrobiota bacterium]
MNRPPPPAAPSRRVPKPAASAAPSAASASGWPTPWVQMKYVSFHPCVYPAMIKAASPGVKAGDLVSVYDRAGQLFGAGLYNPKARVPLRVVAHGNAPFAESDFLGLLDRAVGLRVDLLALPRITDAFRVVHSDGDGLGGLVVDRYSDVLSVEVHSLGVFQRLPHWLPHLHQRLGTRRAVIAVDPHVARVEGIRTPMPPSDPVRTVRIREHGVRFEVDFARGHKTGFFCDQRENRRRVTAWTRDRSVLDLCCYTGGFALAARVAGGARDATGVDLDETAIAQARRNAHLNQVRVDWVHCDAFTYAHQMHRNGRQWDVVVVDPPKFIASRDDAFEGRRKYEDLNGLATRLVAPGGLLVTCSCSGLLGAEEFERLAARGAHRMNRRLQILSRTGAAEDHPVMSNCPESQYLKVLWARVF